MSPNALEGLFPEADVEECQLTRRHQLCAFLVIFFLAMDDAYITDKTAGIIHRKPTVHGRE